MKDHRQWISALQLMPHDEGGWFRQTYQASWRCPTPERSGGSRPGANSILYMLTRDAPRGVLHRNRSDILHFFHAGAPLRYTLVSPDGRLSKHTLGPDPGAGHLQQMLIPGGTWKATHLQSGNFGLVSEVVLPGFDYRDRTLADEALVHTRFPQHLETLRPYLFSADT